VSATRTYSAVEKLRRRWASAAQALKHSQTRHADLQARWKLASEAERPEIERAGWLARLELNDAEERFAAADRALHTEELRLLNPNAPLRFI
jgi:hypothetical protein